MIFYFIMFALLLACTGNLVSRDVELGELLKSSSGSVKKTIRKYVVSLSVALVCYLRVILLNSYFNYN